MKISEYSLVQSLTNNDRFIVETPTGTMTVTAETLLTSLLDTSPVMHRNVYRGKNLGASVTSEQRARVKDGTFKDLWVGDYWQVGGRKFYVADMNVFGGSQHLVVVPDDILVSSEYGTNSDYVNSVLRTRRTHQNVTSVVNPFAPINFTDRTNREFQNMRAHKPEDFSAQVEVMNVRMVYGQDGLMTNSYQDFVGTPEVRNAGQFALFRMNPQLISIGKDYWLRDLVTGSHVQYVDANGILKWRATSEQSGYRPFFLIG